MSSEIKVAPVVGTRLAYVEPLERNGYAAPEEYEWAESIGEANIVTSQSVLHNNKHKLVIDIDLPARLIPSSTPGHFHLYVDKLIPEEKYFALLKALEEASLIEEGYYVASMKRGFTAVRLPWIKKPQPEEIVF